jgi:hypothetical protein
MLASQKGICSIEWVSEWTGEYFSYFFSTKIQLLQNRLVYGTTRKRRVCRDSKFITGIRGLIFVLGVKIVHLIDRTDLFTFSNWVLGGEAIVTDLYSSLEEQREWERNRERVWYRQRERRPVRREEIMLVTTLEERYVTEPTETKCLKFWLLNLLGSSWI